MVLGTIGLKGTCVPTGDGREIIRVSGLYRAHALNVFA